MLINALNLREIEQDILGEYIKQNPHKKIIKRNEAKTKPYVLSFKYYDIEEVTLEFLLAHDILVRQRKADKQGLRYEVIANDPLSEESYGSYGTVYRSLTTLLFKEGYLCATGKHKNRVIKVLSADKKQSESNISCKLKHLHAKPSTIAGTEAYIVLKHMPGEDLQTILSAEKLTTDKKLGLLLALCQALKKQVIDNGLVHRDIKPANIMVDFYSKRAPEVNIIDFGLAKKIGKRCTRLKGSPIYIPPEIMQVHSLNLYSLNAASYLSTPAIDIYALGKIACELFSENCSFAEGEEIHFQNLFNELLASGLSNEAIRAMASFGFNQPIFKEDADLSRIHKAQLEALFRKMCHVDPNKRVSIEFSINLLKLISRERMLFSKLLYLKKTCPVYHILSCYSHLFGIEKRLLESDEKKINQYLKCLNAGKGDLDKIETEIKQITKARKLIKKSNASQVFDTIFQILTECYSEASPKVTQDSEKLKIKLLTYIKTHMGAMIEKKDIHTLARLKAMSDLLDTLKKHVVLDAELKTELQAKLRQILAFQFVDKVSSAYKGSVGFSRTFFEEKQVRLVRDDVVEQAPNIMTNRI